jgi:hypothetical protein
MKIINMLCAFAAVALFATSVNAQCGTSIRRVTPTYTFPTTYQYPVREVVVQDVITPIAVPVLVPAYQFQYVAPCATVATPVAAGVTPVVPFAAPVVPGVSMQQVSYAPGAIGASQMNEQDRINMLAKAIISEMNRLGGQEQTQPQANQQDNGPPVAMEGSFQPQFPRQPPVPQQMSFVNILGNRCASCHTGPSSKGGVQIFTAPGIFNSAVDRQRIVRSMEDGRMPPQAVADPSHRVPVQEIELVKNGLR